MVNKNVLQKSSTSVQYCFDTNTSLNKLSNRDFPVGMGYTIKFPYVQTQ